MWFCRIGARLLLLWLTFSPQLNNFQVAQLSQFDEELYKVTGKASEVATETT